MTRICGIELKSSYAILAVVDTTDDGISFSDIEPRKIKLGNDELAADIQSFCASFKNFIRDNRVDVIVIKKRAKKGKMAGGAVSFKLEALIQMNATIAVEFVSGQGISASDKRKSFEIPDGLNQYQKAAFKAAVFYLRKL